MAALPGEQKGIYAPIGIDKVEQTQRELDETINVYRANVDKLLVRGDDLERLEQRTGDLSNSTAQFRKKASDVRRAMWWKNLKWTLILGGVALVIAVIVIVSILYETGVIKKSN